MNKRVKRFISSGLVLLFSALLLVELTVNGAVSAPHHASTTQPHNSEPVADLFRTNCARCHGADGSGDTPLGHTYHAPDFTDPEWWREHSDITRSRSLESIVTHGKGDMPAFEKKLKRSDIKRLVKYVRGFRK